MSICEIGSVLSNPILRIIQENNVGHDVIFKFYEAGGQISNDVVKGHRVILAAFSDVFKAMFFGHLAEQNRIEDNVVVVVTKDFCHEVYSKLFRLRFLYGEMEIIRCEDINLLFQLYGLAFKYQILNVLPMIRTNICDHEVNYETAIEALATAQFHLNLNSFEKMSQDLIIKAAKAVRRENLTAEDLEEFYNKHSEAHPQLILILKQLMNEVSCDNCHRSLSHCKNKLPIDEAPHTGLSMTDQRDRHFTVGTIENGIEASVMADSLGAQVYQVKIYPSWHSCSRATNLMFPQDFLHQHDLAFNFKYNCTNEEYTRSDSSISDCSSQGSFSSWISDESELVD